MFSSFSKSFSAGRRSVANRQPILNDIILYYRTDNTQSYPGSGTVINDLSQNNLNGSVLNYPNFSSGYFTWTSSDYIVTPDLDSVITAAQEEHSVEIWVMPTGNGVSLQYCGQSTPNTGYHHSAIEIVSGQVEFGLWNGRSITSTGGTGSISFNRWHQIVLTYDGSTIKGYIDGYLVASGTAVSWDSPMNGGRSSFHMIFGYPDFTSQGDGTQFDGRFGIMRVYGRAISASEVLDNYNADRYSFSPELYPNNPILALDASLHVAGSIWKDQSGFGNDGTIFNSATISGNYFSLNGTNQYFSIPSGFSDFTRGITILAFVDFGNASNWERIIDFGNGPGSDNILFSRSGTTNNLAFQVYNNSGSLIVNISLANGILNNSWGFYGVRIDGSNYKILNHITSSSGTAANLPSNTVRLNNYVGRSNWSEDAYFQSKIGMVLVYDKSLTDFEIDEFYSRNKSTYGL